jgi:hypothetical protein
MVDLTQADKDIIFIKLNHARIVLEGAKFCSDGRYEKYTGQAQINELKKVLIEVMQYLEKKELEGIL